jgi:hypothetical protein
MVQHASLFSQMIGLINRKNSHQLVSVEPNGVFTMEPFYIQKLMGLDRQSV